MTRHQSLIQKDVLVSSAPPCYCCAGLAPEGFQPPGKNCCQSSCAAPFYPDNSPYSFPATLDA